MESVKIVLITQARSGSTRLPRKVLKKINDKTLLQIHVERLKKCKKINEIIVATTTAKEDDQIYNLSLQMGVKSSRGSEDDVLDRYYQAALPLSPAWVVRVTSDCPLIDPKLVDDIINFAINSNSDYITNAVEGKYPDGQDVEVFTFESLKKAWLNAAKKSEREHVTPYIRNNSNNEGNNQFKVENYPYKEDYSNIRMTVDELEDYNLIKSLVNELGSELSWLEYTEYIIKNNLEKFNMHIQRNEGYLNSISKDKV